MKSRCMQVLKTHHNFLSPSPLHQNPVGTPSQMNVRANQARALAQVCSRARWRPPIRSQHGSKSCSLFICLWAAPLKLDLFSTRSPSQIYVTSADAPLPEGLYGAVSPLCAHPKFSNYADAPTRKKREHNLSLSQYRLAVETQLPCPLRLDVIEIPCVHPCGNYNPGLGRVH